MISTRTLGYNNHEVRWTCSRVGELGKANESKYSAPALSKGLDILEVLSQEADGLSLSEISAALCRSTSEIFRMLYVLEERGYVRTLPHSDKYALTLKLLELSFRQPRVKKLTAAALPVMRGLCIKLHQSCHLVIQYSGRGVVIAQHESPAESGFAVRLGAEVPLVGTCSGNILLAYSGPDYRRIMVSEQPSHLKRKFVDREFEVTAERICQNGFEQVKSSLTLGIEDIGCPVIDHTGTVAAALVVPFLPHLDETPVPTVEEAIPALKAAAAEISASLGYSSSVVTKA